MTDDSKCVPTQRARCHSRLDPKNMKNVRQRIEERIARRRSEDVFLPREFRDLGSERQVSQALRDLVSEKRLLRLGHGVHGRAIISRLSGEPILYSRRGFISATEQALTKLGVDWEPTEATQAYNEGRSTQLPANPVLKVKGRFSRKLRDGDQELIVIRKGQGLKI